MFHNNFYSKPKIDFDDVEISEETLQKLQILKHNYNKIACKHSSDIGLPHLEEMPIESSPELPPAASKPYPLPLKHDKFIKEETENLLEATLIERSMSPYATPITVDPRKSKLSAPLTETKRLVISD